MRPVKTRYAPSPTGSLHLGGLRTALFNYLHARQSPDGKFLLRIEDTDQARTVPGAAEALQSTLTAFGMPPDEPVQKQSDRLELYSKHAEILVQKGLAYPCFCSACRLADLRKGQVANGMRSMYDRHCRGIPLGDSMAMVNDGKPHTLRLKAPLEGNTVVDDSVRGKVTFDNSLMDDQILIKSDGFPTYHLASVVDDHDMGITNVIRGEEWLPSTPKHLLLYDMFGWEAPEFSHLPLLLNKNRSKLSKRNNDLSVDDLLNVQGYSHSTIINFVALLGWSPQAKHDLFDSDDDELRMETVFPTMESLVSAFKLENASKRGAVVDVDFLHWLSGQHMRKLDRDFLVSEARGQFGGCSCCFSDEYLHQVVELVISRVDKVKELGSFTNHFLLPLERTEDLVWCDVGDRNVRVDILCVVRERLGGLEDWNERSIRECLKSSLSLLGSGVKMSDLMLSVRWGVTGSFRGAGLAETLSLLGQARVLRRLEVLELKE